MKNNIRGNASSVVFMALAVVMVLIGLGFLITYTWRVVEGNEIGVKETWAKGVDPNPLQPRTYWINRWTEAIYTYPTSGQVFVMNDTPSAKEPVSAGRDVDPLYVNSLDNQKVSFHVIVTWRISPAHVVNLHKNYRSHIEEKLIRPEVIKAVMTRATVQNAIDLYSGKELNQLRAEVEAELRDPNGKLALEGAAVDSFVVEKPDFPNQEYVAKIEARQLAIITESMAKEQKKANDALAEAARSAAQKEANERIVKAEADKQVAILAQEATARQSIIQVQADAENNVTRQKAESAKIVLAAEAEKARQIAISDGAKQAEINRAVGIKAVGESEANRNQLLLASFSVPGSDNYVKVKVAEQFARGMDSVRFYPSSATFNSVAESFQKGVGLLMSTGVPAAPIAPVAEAK